jgi:hypothetical protein
MLMKTTIQDDIYLIVEKAIDYAFEEKKFLLKFYEYLQSTKTTGIQVKEFNESGTANELRQIIGELEGYIEGGKDNEHKMLREAYGHLPKSEARKIKNYLNAILEDASQYERDKRRGRRKSKNK